jgi:hypothetical protein
MTPQHHDQALRQATLNCAATAAESREPTNTVAAPTGNANHDEPDTIVFARDTPFNRTVLAAISTTRVSDDDRVRLKLIDPPEDNVIDGFVHGPVIVNTGAVG